MEAEQKLPELRTTTEHLSGHLADYAETYLQLTALKATQKATDAATLGFTAVMISFFGMIVLIFLGFGIATWLTESMTEKEAYFIVTGIYAFIGAIVFLFRRQLIFPFLKDTIVSKIYEGKN